MNNLSLIFLGTGTSQGVPPIGCNHPVCLSTNPKDKRLRTSAAIQFNNQTLIIDCGPDFRQQLIRENISDINAVLFTHEHNDHVTGLDDIRPIVFKQGKDLDIYLDEKTLNALEIRFPYVFDRTKGYPGIARVNPHILNGNMFQLDDFRIQPLEVLHGNLPIWGFKINDSLAYITDASTIPNQTMEELKDLDILVINALRKEPEHFSHFTLSQAIEIIEKTQPKKAYITHISYEMGFHNEVQQELPENVFLAYDGLKITI